MIGEIFNGFEFESFLYPNNDLKEASLILTRRSGNLILSLTDGAPFSIFCGDQVSVIMIKIILKIIIIVILFSLSLMTYHSFL